VTGVGITGAAAVGLATRHHASHERARAHQIKRGQRGSDALDARARLRNGTFGWQGHEVLDLSSSFTYCDARQMTNQAALSPCALGILAERLGPLPLINHFLARMGLLELLEQHVPTTDARSTVSHAQALGVLLRSIQSSSASRSTASRRARSGSLPVCSASMQRRPPA